MQVFPISSLFLLCLANFLVFSIADSDEGGELVEGSVGLPIQSDIEGRVLVGQDVLRRGNARVIINGGEKVVYIAGDGTFLVHAMPPGSHILDFHVGDLIFSQIRVDVSKRTRGKVRANALTPRLQSEHVNYPLMLEPLGTSKYFIPREGGQLMGMLKSPMGIMLIVTAVCLLILPKMNTEELQEMMKNPQEAAKKYQDEIRTAGRGEIN
eukprot:TRINITY_DN61276_c0_g1_i1.p1 TRINITY_DN61276_c0_g1~~TRINITY_DN61276_c0_g1_i1.p1  ORF type:complete len:210 (+),score=14.61 TRINITY_DN61276_c0_g1_i1:86-715(+)